MKDLRRYTKLHPDATQPDGHQVRYPKNRFL